jgi:hypothetical protein
VHDKFFDAEVLETAVSAGVVSARSPTGGIEGFQLGTQLDLSVQASNVMKIASVQIATQLSEMTLGVREKFDPAAIGMQVVSTLAAVQIADKISNVGLSVPAGKVAISASNLVVNSSIAAATHTPVNVQQAAMQAISGMVADEARSYVQNRTETPSFVNDYEKPELVNIAKPKLVVPKPAYGEVSYAMGVLNQARMANEHASSKHNGSTSYAMSELNQAKMNQSQRNKRCQARMAPSRY